jgi:3-mercaptopyruvate sulfurtransferase SseA
LPNDSEGPSFPAGAGEPGDAQLRRLYFRLKLAAETELLAVARQVEAGGGELVLLDVRDAASYAAGHIPGALNLPLAELPERAAELDRGRAYVTYCWRTT